MAPFGSLTPGFQMPQMQMNDPSLGGMIPQLMKMAQARQQQQQPQPQGGGAAMPGGQVGGIMGMLASLFGKKPPGAPMDLAAPGNPSNMVPTIPVATENAPGPNQLTGMW